MESKAKAKPVAKRTSPHAAKNGGLRVGITVAVRVRPLVKEELDCKETIITGMPQTMADAGVKQGSISLKTEMYGRDKQFAFRCVCAGSLPYGL